MRRVKAMAPKARCGRSPLDGGLPAWLLSMVRAYAADDGWWAR